MPSTDFSDIFSAHFQPLENVLGLVQNLNQNLVTELAPLGLGDLSGLKLAEVDVVLVSHAQRLDDFFDIVKHFSDIFSAHFQPLENILGLVQNLNQNLVAEFAPLGLGDLSGLKLAEVDVVFVSHAQRLDDFSDAVNEFCVFFQIFFYRRPGVYT